MELFLRQLKWSFQYAKLTLKHKWYFALAARKMHCSLWSIITHDLSKFSPSQLPHYGRQFFGDKARPDLFDVAWLHHQNREPHHWEYWVTRSSHTLSSFRVVDENSPVVYPIPIPEKYVREMIADWLAASKTHTGDWDIQVWVWRNVKKMKLCPSTKTSIQRILLEIGVGI